MFAEPSFAQHFTGIAANRYRNSSLEIMMIVKGEPVRKFRNAAFIIGDMTKIFANILEITFETTYGH